MKPKLLIILFITLNWTVFGQFNSGSTGADGALDLSVGCPGTSPSPNTCVLQMPESGVFNFTTVSIPNGSLLFFKRNSQNTPVFLLAQGDVTINGQLRVYSPCIGAPSGFCVNGNEPGPGGFYGGAEGRPGFGPGGGQTGVNSGNARWIGPLSLVPIVGGSGGAYPEGTGRGGGGAIVIASSSSINFTGGWIDAGSHEVFPGGGGAGSGGAIRLIANSIEGNGQLHACSVNCGVIRLEATSVSSNITTYPAAVVAPINPAIFPSSLPNLAITSVGGHAVPSYAGSSFIRVDLLLPNQLSDPINVGVSANNIPAGTEVHVGLVSGSPTGTSSPCLLSGTFENSSCTATISNLNRTAVTYLLATAAFDPPASLAKHNPPGADQVTKVRMEATLGGPTKYVFLDKSEKIIEEERIAPEFLSYFGK